MLFKLAWPTRENRQNFDIFLIFPAYGENGLRWPQIGPGGFFLLIQTLPTFWAERIWISTLFLFVFWIPNFWFSRSPDFQVSRTLTWAWLGRAWAWPGPEIAGAPSAAAPRQLQTTKFGRSKELGHYHGNPISANPVWGSRFVLSRSGALVSGQGLNSCLCLLLI